MQDAAAMLMDAAQALLQAAQALSGGGGGKGGGILGSLLGVGAGMLLGGAGKGGGGGGFGGLLSGLLFPKSKIFGSPLSSLMGGMGGGGGFSASSLGGLGGTLGSVPLNLGFSSGGFTGSGADNEPAGIVHKNEWVWDSDTTNKWMPVLQMIGSGKLPSFHGPGLGRTMGRGANSNQPLHINVGDVHLHGVTDERSARQTGNQFLSHIQQRTARAVKKGLNQ